MTPEQKARELSRYFALDILLGDDLNTMVMSSIATALREKDEEISQLKEDRDYFKSELKYYLSESFEQDAEIRRLREALEKLKEEIHCCKSQCDRENEKGLGIIQEALQGSEPKEPSVMATLPKETVERIMKGLE